MQRRILLTSTLALTTLVMTGCPSEGGGDDESGQTETSDTGSGSDTTGDGDTTAGDTTAGDTGTDTGNGSFCDVDPGWGPLVEGEPVKHIQGFDHTGAEFNLCTYGGTPIILDIAAVWCGPCNDVSNYLANGGADPFGGGLGGQLTTLINGGTVVWATMLVQDANSGPATVDNAAAWDGMYHNENIPVVVGDTDVQMLPTYFNLGCWPSAFIVDHEMNWMGFDDCTTWNQLVEVVQTYGG